MTNLNRFWLRVSLVATVTQLAGLARDVSAAPATFNVVQSLSSYTYVDINNTPNPSPPLADSTILGVPIVAQVPGGDVDALSGTIVGDETGGVLTFNGASTITPVANAAGPFVPADFPGTDSFGVVTNAATPVGVVSVAVRDWQFTIPSGTATNGALPSDGSLTLSTTAGYQVNSFSGQQTLVGQSGPDVATTAILLTTVGNIHWLDIPVIRLPTAGTPGQIYLNGQIVGSENIGILGDVNGDGIVNGQDIAGIASHWLNAGVAKVGDTTGDGIVNGQDIAAVASNWLHTAGGGSGLATSATVPEPGSLALLTLGGFALALFGVRRRQRRQTTEQLATEAHCWTSQRWHPVRA